MHRLRLQMSTALALLVGVLLGWGLANFRPALLHASAGDRSGESIVATGSVMVRVDEGSKAAVPLEALYFLDYKGGRLLATVPTYRQTSEATHLIDTFFERDLAADFKLDLDLGPRPRFLMTTGSIGSYSAGWAPLYVFETTTRQVAVYRMQVAETIGTGSRSQFELVELRSYAKEGGPEPRR
jgi:hypothetical protein